MLFCFISHIDFGIVRSLNQISIVFHVAEIHISELNEVISIVELCFYDLLSFLDF